MRPNPDELPDLPRRTAVIVAAALLLAPGAPATSGGGLAAQAASPSERAGEVASMLDLALTEYRDAVRDGRVINEAEYGESRQFTAEAARLFGELAGTGHGAEAGGIAAGLDSLVALVERKGPVASYRETVRRLTGELAQRWGAVSVPEPDRPPSAARGAALYRRACAACHGPAGRGDGWAAGGMEPPPTDLGSNLRRREATPARDYQVIVYGIPETAMPTSKDWLSPERAWDLVAYLQTLRFGAAEVAEGKGLALGDGGSPVAGRIRAWASPASSARLTDVELARRVRERWREAAPPGSADTLAGEQARAVVAYVRTLTGTPATGVPETDRSAVLAGRVAEADSLAGAAAELFRSGREEEGRRAALRAYGAFEGVEPELRARASGLVRELEGAFGDLRGASDGAAAAAARGRVDRLLARAEDELVGSAGAWSVATQSFVTILREGFEAILIIGAILAFLVKTGHRERKRDVYWGVGVALAASLVTAGLMKWVLTVTPASREVLEGGVMLLAVAVLFSVSYWLVSKLEHEKWQAYLRGKMQSALGAGGGLALAGVAFLAVYREGFETVIFYQAIASYSSAGLLPVGAGFAAGCVALAIIYLLFTRYGMKLPMRPFFAGTSALLYSMAVVFAGSGIHELQAAGVVGTTPAPGLPRLAVLGLYPTVETLAAQGGLLLLLAAGLCWTFRPASLRRGGAARVESSPERAGGADTAAGRA